MMDLTSDQTMNEEVVQKPFRAQAETPAAQFQRISAIPVEPRSGEVSPHPTTPVK